MDRSDFSTFSCVSATRNIYFYVLLHFFSLSDYVLGRRTAIPGLLENFSARDTLLYMSQFSAQDIARAAKEAFEQSQLIPASERVLGLHEIRKELAASKDGILAANKDDLQVGANSFLLRNRLTV